jgi:hypothetical protein
MKQVLSYLIIFAFVFAIVFMKVSNRFYDKDKLAIHIKNNKIKLGDLPNVTLTPFGRILRKLSAALFILFGVLLVSYYWFYTG